MKKIIIHIGMHKTGTSSIQKAMKGYNDGESVYSSFDNENNSIPMFTIFSENRYLYHPWKKLGLSAQQVEEKRAQFQYILDKDLENNLGKRNIIISGEDISILSKAEKYRMLKLFEKKGWDIEVIGFVRHPFEYASSNLQEHIKGGSKYIFEISTRFKEKIEPFVEYLGINKVKVYDYDELCLKYGDISEAFFALLGLKFTGTVRVNSSFSSGAIRLIYKLNSIPIYTFGNKSRISARNKFMRMASSCYPKELSKPLDREIMASCLQKNFINDVEYLEGKFKISYPIRKIDKSITDIVNYITDFSEFDFANILEYMNDLKLPYGSEPNVEEIVTLIYAKLLIEESIGDTD